MNATMYSVLDVLAKEWGNPFLAKNDDVALRLVRNSLKNSVSLDVSEYELYNVGTFDSETGIVGGYKTAKKVIGSLFPVKETNLSFAPEVKNER